MSDIMNKLYVSTGTIVGKANGYDHKVITENFENFSCDGYELMMLGFWYKKLDKVAADLRSSGIYTPVIHFDKDIGVIFAENDERFVPKAIDFFRMNAEFAEEIGAKKAVFHLWGGPKSDGNIDMATGLLPELIAECEKHGVMLLIENIPCKYSDPLSVWGKINERQPDVNFIFDTRFGAFHGQYLDIFASPLWKKVKHMHISSYSGVVNEWGLIRPILHPGEGTVDFDHVFSNMPHYDESITIESPVLRDDGTLDVEKMRGTIAYMRNLIEKYRVYEK